MTLSITGIVASYILLALLLLSINIYSRWSWTVKAGTIILTSAFYFISYLSLPSILGWPTQASLPERFRVISTHVVQPDKSTNTDGAIYIWAEEMDAMTAITTLPRAYALPYSKKLHEEITYVRGRIDKGISQIGEFKEPEDNMIEVNNQSRTTQVSVEIDFYDIPDPLFPDK